jgi:7-keto-8-aminopelargonate synthetase-like enzyme
LHNKFEHELAEFLGKQDCMTFGTGFQTNLGIISAIAGHRDILNYDKYNHASLIDAARLSGAKLRRFEHNNMEHLEKILRDCPDNVGKLLVVDGVFSMEGDLTNLPEVVRLKKKYNARLMVDDSHGAGVMGKTGRGTGEHFGLQHEIDLYMGTFSKSFACLGGFVAADRRVIEFAHHASRPFIYSASIPPSNAAVVLEALKIIKEETDRMEKTSENAEYMRKGFKRRGIPTMESQAPIIPVMTYELMRTLKITQALLMGGVYINPVVPTAVPDGKCLLRTSYTATHTKEQLDYALDVFDGVFKKYKE